MTADFFRVGKAYRITMEWKNADGPQVVTYDMIVKEIRRNGLFSVKYHISDDDNNVWYNGGFFYFRKMKAIKQITIDE